ncbi:chalcone synthase B [Fusarium pseudoanthophilum]|uniref:Chalcone synthase B n=1 Tax=Fusarium pseudoanthophilum TaxID=48495 RepID=A0A8H5NJY9_9HYPO|nr:chalcone synthase B [Fusarium pseudoanthophilum]
MGTDQASVYIVGLGHYYPPYINGHEDIEGYLAKFCDTKAPAVRKLLQINQNTGIKGRPNIISRDDPLFNGSEPPTISELDSVFRTPAVDLAARACKKAIAEWKGKVSEITHTVAATGTNTGSPGYDLLVNDRLGICPEAQRMLLSSIGCAGGLATIRMAATIANDAALRRRPACVLGFACDVTSTNIRCDLKMISENPKEVRPSMALFSDASAAFVICNSLGLKANRNAIYTVLDWENSVIPGTQSDENCLIDPLGFRLFMSPNLPVTLKSAVIPLFERLIARNAWQLPRDKLRLAAIDFDWIMHPAGLAVLDEVKESLNLQDGQMRASFDVFENKGNSAGPTVLIVLDRLRKMGGMREHIVAYSFGPGVCAEMTALNPFRG